MQCKCEVGNASSKLVIKSAAARAVRRNCVVVDQAVAQRGRGDDASACGDTKRSNKAGQAEGASVQQRSWLSSILRVRACALWVLAWSDSIHAGRI